MYQVSIPQKKNENENQFDFRSVTDFVLELVLKSQSVRLSCGVFTKLLDNGFEFVGDGFIVVHRRR